MWVTRNKWGGGFHSHAHSPDALAASPLLLVLVLLLLGLGLRRRARSAGQGLECYFGGVLFGVVHVLSVIPEASVDGLVASDGDGGGPSGAAAAAVRDDVEDGRVELGAAAVI